MARTGVLIVATGGPAVLDDVPAFIEASLGAPPSEGQLSAARRTYLAIGGSSPVPVVAERVAAALERRLNGLPPADLDFQPGDTLSALAEPESGRAEEPVEMPVLVGMRAADPTIARSIDLFKRIGVERVVAVELASFERSSIAASDRSMTEAAASHYGLELVWADDFSGDEGLGIALEAGYEEALGEIIPSHESVIVFSAKAVTGAEAASSDYISRVEAAAERMARLLDLGERDDDGLRDRLGIEAAGGPGTRAPWLAAYQSAEPLEDAVGPDVFAVIEAAREHGFTAVGVLPIGLSFDEVETLWTLDILAADMALSQDMEWARGAVANEKAELVQAIERVVRAVL